MNINSAMAVRGALLVGSMLTMGTSAFAVPIFGDLGFSGTRLFSFTIPSGLNAGSFIDFQMPAGGTNGAIDSDGTSGFFNIVPNNDPGFIKDLATAPNSLGYSVAPVGVNVSIDNFITLASLLTTNIRLTQLPAATSCSGSVVCIGAFQLSQNGPHVSVSLNLIGQFINGGDITPYNGQITAQFLNTSIAAVIGGASSQTGVLANSYSGALSAIPEPETATLLGIGLIAMILGGLRAKKRSNV